MNKNFVVRPNMGVLLNYFSISLPHFYDLPKSSLWKDMNNICKDGKAAYDIFYLFGAFDVLNIGISDDIKKLDAMQKIKAYQKIKGVMDFFMHYGMVVGLYPKPFNFKKAVNQNPIIGIITIKVRSEGWEGIYRDFDTINKLKKKINMLFKEALKKTKNECPVNSKNYKALLMLSYDHADVIIIFFADSFQFIKKFTTNVRTLELKDINPNLSSKKVKHIVASTNTILGVNIEKHNNNLRIYIPSTNNTYDELNWLTFFKTRPGHLQHAKNEISKGFKIYPQNYSRSKKDKITEIKLKVSPIIGRNDLIAFPEKSSGENLSKFLNTHFNIIKELSNNRSILSSETYISFPKLDEVESDRSPGRVYSPTLSIEADAQDLINKIGKSRKLHKFEKESFIQILRKLIYLLEEEDSHDSFITLTPIIFRGIVQLLILKPRELKEAITNILYYWTGMLELCYATRYQGSPPIGETAVCPTLGYYSSGQKPLILLDYLGNWIISGFCRKIGAKKFEPYYIATVNINSPDAAAFIMKPLPIAFIMLPPRPLFHTEISMVTFFHELGHVIYKSFISSPIMKEKLKKFKIKEQKDIAEKLSFFEEEIAELFTAKILSKLNFNKHERLTNNALRQFECGLLRGRLMTDGKKSQTNCAKLLYKRVKDNDMRKTTPFVFEFLKFVVTSIENWQDDKIAKKVRLVVNCTGGKRQEEYWNLWLLLNSARDKCYVAQTKR